MGKQQDDVKLTVFIRRDLSEALWTYIRKTYPGSTYGKQREVVEEALEKFLGKK